MEKRDSRDERSEGSQDPILSLEIPAVPEIGHEMSISPRDRLSYIDDRKAWKEFEKFEGDRVSFARLMHRLQKAVIDNKPADIVEFVALQFFSPENQIELRREIKEVKEFSSANRDD